MMFIISVGESPLALCSPVGISANEPVLCTASCHVDCVCWASPADTGHCWVFESPGVPLTQPIPSGLGTFSLVSHLLGCTTPSLRECLSLLLDRSCLQRLSSCPLPLLLSSLVNAHIPGQGSQVLGFTSISSMVGGCSLPALEQLGHQGLNLTGS